MAFVLQTESIIKHLSALENSASCDAVIREKIAKLPPEVSDISQLAKLHGNVHNGNCIQMKSVK